MILLSRVGRNISNIISCYIISRRSRLCFFRGGFFIKILQKDNWLSLRAHFFMLEN